MHRVCRWAVPLIVGLAGCGSASRPGAVSPTGEVGLQVVKMPELKRAIAAHAGKVIVIDVWADY